MNNLLPGLVLCGAVVTLPAWLSAVPTVSNVQFNQEANGAGASRAVVTYDLAGSAGTATVALAASSDGGVTFDLIPVSVSGDHGAGIADGTGRTISWDVSMDLAAFASSAAVVRVLAEDSTSNLTVANHSFEADAQPPATLTVTAPPDWLIHNPANIDGAFDVVGTLNPNGSTHFSSVPDGGNVALCFLDGPAVGEAGLRQVLSATLQANRVYTARVEVGNINEGTANFGYFNLLGFPGYRVDLLAGSTVIAADNNTLDGTIPEGEFRATSIIADIGATHPELGNSLQIRLVNLNIPGTMAEPGIEVNFDNVRVIETARADSAAGLLETTDPIPGAASPPSSASATPIAIPFSGAMDVHSGIALVRLWYRADSGVWTDSGLSETTASGTFFFTPPGVPPANHGLYHFTVVAEDNAGNRSPEPAGMAGTGDGTTDFNSSAGVQEWQAFEN